MSEQNNITPSKTDILKITLRRDMTTGRIMMRLQGNPDTFKPLRSDAETNQFWFLGDEKLNTYYCRRDSIAGMRFNTSSYVNFDTTSSMNGSMLLSPQLAGGVEYPVTDGPIDDDAVVDFRNRFKDAVRSLYKSYLRPLSLTVTISTVETETL
jgi:hypothetical protein